jgi:hypothetical protein
VTGALQALLGDGPRDPEAVQQAVERATAVALRPWIAHDVRHMAPPNV